MTAAVKIHEMTASRSGYDKTSGTVRFKSVNAIIVDSENRLQVPGSGTIFSFHKQLRMYVATAPSVDLQNLKAYTDGVNSFGTGIGVQYDLEASSYSTPASLDISGTDIFTASISTPIDMDSGLASSAFLGTGYKGKLLRVQMSVGSSAAPGTLSAEVLSIAYDET